MNTKRCRPTRTHVTPRSLYGVCLLTIAVLMGCQRNHNQTVQQQPAKQQLDPKGLTFATFMLADDIQNGLLGNKSLSTSAATKELVSLADIDDQVTASTYDQQYDQNEIAADDLFKGRRLAVSGIVQSIERDFTGSAYLNLGAAEMLSPVHASIKDHSLHAASLLRRNQKITLICKGGGRVAGVALLEQCEPVADYIDGLHLGIRMQVAGVLQGSRPSSDSTASVVAFIYVLGRTLPPNSACLQGDKDSCEAEFASIAKDSARVTSLKAEAEQIVAARSK